MVFLFNFILLYIFVKYIFLILRIYFIYIFKKNQLHAICRIQQSRQREPSVKALHTLLSAETWRHCLLSGKTQRRALPGHQSEEMKILIQINILFPRVGIEPTTTRFCSHT